MDLQLYFDNIVYPVLNLLLDKYECSEIDRNTAFQIARKICFVKSCLIKHNLNLQIMGDDAFGYFKTEISY